MNYLMAHVFKIVVYRNKICLEIPKKTKSYGIVGLTSPVIHETVKQKCATRTVERVRCLTKT